MLAMTNKIIAHYGSTLACIKGGVQDPVQQLSCTQGVQYKNPIYQYIKMPINCTRGCKVYMWTIIAPRVQVKDSRGKIALLGLIWWCFVFCLSDSSVKASEVCLNKHVDNVARCWRIKHMKKEEVLSKWQVFEVEKKFVLSCADRWHHILGCLSKPVGWNR